MSGQPDEQGGAAALDGWGLTESERLRISAVVHQNYYMPDVFQLVADIIAERMQGTTTVEWNARHGDAPRTVYGPRGTTEGSARSTVAKSSPGLVLVRRERTTYPDRVTDWEVAP